MTEIIDGIVSAAREHAGARIKDVVIGLGFTMVRLDESCGLAYTLRENLKTGCEAFEEAGSIIGKELEEVLSWIGKGSPTASAIGLAAANAVLKPPDSCLDVNLLDSLDLQRGERVVTVGKFKPMEPELKSRGVHLGVIEWGDSPGLLSDCDVALITGTSIINNTVDSLLEQAGNAREVVILGPSTPYSPNAFSGTPVTRLAGSVIQDPVRVREVVSQGGGTKTLGKSLSRWVATI